VCLMMGLIPCRLLLLCQWEFFSRASSRRNGVEGFVRISTGESPCLPSLWVHLRSQKARRDIITVLQALVCSLRRDFWLWCFAGVRRHHRPPNSGGLLVWESPRVWLVSPSRDRIIYISFQKSKYKFVIDLVSLLLDVTEYVIE